MTHDTITIVRTLNAPREAVFDAWITPDSFARWFGGAAVVVPADSVRIDARPGGRWDAIMHLPGGDTMVWGGEYTAVNRAEHLAFTMSDEPGEPAGAPITVDFAAVDGGTRMTLVQTGVGDFTSEQYDLTIAGYNAYFDALEMVVE